MAEMTVPHIVIFRKGIFEAEMISDALIMHGWEVSVSREDPQTAPLPEKCCVMISADGLEPEATAEFLDGICRRDEIVFIMVFASYERICDAVYYYPDDRVRLMMRPLYGKSVAVAVAKHFRAAGGSAKPDSGSDLNAAAFELLTSRGYRTSYQGFDALRYGIVYLAGKDEKVQLSAELYPYIAKKTGQNPAAVEKAIRVANKAVWSAADAGTFSEYFPELAGKRLPRNGEVFRALAGRIGKPE